MKRPIFIIVFSCIVFCLPVTELKSQPTFQKIYNVADYDYGTSIQLTFDGGYILLGNNGGVFQPGQQDISVIKIDAFGNIEWTKVYGDSLTIDLGYCISQTPDTGFIISGESHGSVLLMKTDNSGNLMWSKKYGSQWADEAYSVVQSLDNEYLLAGMTDNFGASLGDLYFIKTDLSGDTLWTKLFGSTGYDKTFDVIQTRDSNYFACGFTNFGPGVWSDPFLLKMDSHGNLIWLKTYPVGPGVENAASLIQTSDGGFILAGVKENYGVNNTDGLVIKTDSAGEVLWIKTYGDTLNDDIASILQTTDGGYLFSGYSLSFGQCPWLVKIDSTGNVIWSRALPNDKFSNATSLHTTVDGGFIFSGDYYDPALSDGSFYIMKTDSNGNGGCIESNPNVIVDTINLTAVSQTPSISSGSLPDTTGILIDTGGTVMSVCTTTTVDDNKPSNNFLVAPNPASTQISVQGFFEDVSQVFIFNMQGQKILEVVPEKFKSSDNIQIDLSGISSGIYLLCIVGENGKKILKLVKE